MAKKRKSVTFKQAVEQTQSVSDEYKMGLQAIKPVDRQRISCNDPRCLSGSVNLDSAIDEPNSPVWDYGIGYVQTSSPQKGDAVYWVEVHPANSKHVKDVIKKLNWLKKWLEQDAPKLKLLPCKFVWVASGAVALPQNSPQRRKLASCGIRFVGSQLKIPSR